MHEAGSTTSVDYDAKRDAETREVHWTCTSKEEFYNGHL